MNINLRKHSAAIERLLMILFIFSAMTMSVKAQSDSAELPKDIVSVDGRHYTIQVDNNILDFQLPDDYICFTQDKEASKDAYAIYDTFYDSIIQHNIHLYIYNRNTQNFLYIQIEDGVLEPSENRQNGSGEISQN